MSKMSENTTSPQSTSSAAASPAKTSASQPEAKSADSANAADSGSNSPGSSENSDPIGSLLKTFLISKTTVPTSSSLIWQKQTTPQLRPWWVLTFSKRRSKGSASIFSLITTITLVNALERVWSMDGRFHQTPKGRWRKFAKTGTDGSMNWAQEMLVRRVIQKNPNLQPTPEAGESFMGFPIGHTDLTR